MTFADQFGLFHDKVLSFATCLCSNYRYPIARLLIKVHKPVIEGRLLASGTQWLTNPIAVLLAQQLQPVVNQHASIAKDSAEVTAAFEQCAAEHGSANMATFDVESLYPSIHHRRCRAAVARVLHAYAASGARRGMHKGAWVELLLRLFDIIIAAQIVIFQAGTADQPSFYEQVQGITTGLACATQLANLFLVGLDLLAMASFDNLIYNYKRFVDDILVMYHGAVRLDDILAVLNSWDDTINVTHEASEVPTNVHFLDVDYTIRPAVTFKTYRKPQCLYCYTPFTSCHPNSIKRSIVLTELVRLLRTNSSEELYLNSVQFFIAKARLRGYPLSLLHQCLAARPWAYRHVIANKSCAPKAQQRVVPFKITYFAGAEAWHLARHLHEHAYLLQHVAGQSFRIVLCYLSNVNLFRQRYARFTPGGEKPP